MDRWLLAAAESRSGFSEVRDSVPQPESQEVIEQEGRKNGSPGTRIVAGAADQEGRSIATNESQIVDG